MLSANNFLYDLHVAATATGAAGIDVLADILCGHSFSRARRTAASAWRNLLHLMWLPCARDLSHLSQIVCRSSACMGAPLIRTVRRRAVMLPPLWPVGRRVGRRPARVQRAFPRCRIPRCCSHQTAQARDSQGAVARRCGCNLGTFL